MDPGPGQVVIIRTGVANLASVLAAFERLGTAAVVTEDRSIVEAAPRLVLPGVGAFGAGMERLRALGLDDALVRRVRDGRPTLAVCLGLQMLAEASEETPGVAGLGIVPGVVRRFQPGPGLRVPQLGWNQVAPGPGCRLLQPGHAYFANSYRLVDVPEGWSAAVTDHGGPFVAAMERGSVLACQFHPELSGTWGRALLERWLGVPC